MASRIHELDLADRSSPSEFEKIEKLGEGAYGEVWKCNHIPTGIICAVKIMSFEHEEEMLDLLKEVEVLRECNSEYIVRYSGFFRVHESAQSETPTLWIVMEYCSAGSVLDCMSICNATLTEPQIGAVMYFTLKALSYIHKTKKIHRDIKAGNILVNESGICKLADFGVSGRITETHKYRNTVIGTPFWMAPEVIKETGHDSKADIWSLGITAIELAEGKPPFSHIHPMRAIFIIPTRPPPKLTEPEKWTPAFNDFVAKCLTKDQHARPTADELLEDPWIRQFSDLSSSHLLPLIRETEALIEEAGGRDAFFCSDEESNESSDVGSSRDSETDDDSDDNESDTGGTMVRMLTPQQLPRSTNPTIPPPESPSYTTTPPVSSSSSSSAPSVAAPASDLARFSIAELKEQIARLDAKMEEEIAKVRNHYAKLRRPVS